MRSRRRLGVILVLICTAHQVQAAQVETVDVVYEQGIYEVSMTVLVDVSARAAYAVMTDFENLPEVNESIVKAERLPGGRLHTQVDMCVSVFCRSIEQIQKVETNPPVKLRMSVIPELSDFKFGVAEWRFTTVNPQSSRLHFNTRLEPDFWIPPLIGPWLVKRKMQQEARRTSQGIERVAHAEAHSEANGY